MKSYKELIESEDLKFQKYLSDVLYKTTRKLRSSNNVSHIDFKKMFELLTKEEAQRILNLAIKYEEFHPDNIKIYQKIINKK